MNKPEYRIFDDENGHYTVCVDHLGAALQEDAKKFDLRESQISYTTYEGAEQCRHCVRAEAKTEKLMKYYPNDYRNSLDEHSRKALQAIQDGKLLLAKVESAIAAHYANLLINVPTAIKHETGLQSHNGVRFNEDWYKYESSTWSD